MIEYDGHVMPDVVKIGPVYYKILIDNCGVNWAETKSDEFTITFDPGIPHGEKSKEIAIHEFCHAINNTYAPVVFNQKGYRAKIRARDLDEIVAGAYGYGWLGFMRDNPIWIFYLMEGVIRVGFSGDDGEGADEEGDSEGEDPGSPEDPPGHAGYLRGAGQGSAVRR